MIVLLSTTLQAQEKTVKIMNNHWQPYYGDELTHHGIVGEIITEIFKRKGYIVNYKTAAWARALKEVQALRSDSVATAYYTDERAKIYYYSESYMESPTGFFARKDSGITWRTINDLKPYTIGVIPENVYSTEFDAADFLKKQYTSHEIFNLKKLIMRRIDITVLDKFVGYYLLRNKITEGSDTVMFLEPPLKTHKLYLMFHRSNPRAQVKIKAFNEGLKSVQQDGTLKRILEKYNLGSP